MSKAQYLTKSRFKIGCECPTKLFYQDDVAYENSKQDDSFLKALAEGGFQVGELAKLYMAGGTEITNRNKNEAAAETAELLKQNNVIIYEACFKFENLFVKTDIVVKKGDFIELIEVKSKSYNGSETTFFNAKQTALNSSWEPYIVDIAYQAYVFKRSYPHLKYTTALMLPDKTVESSVDGLNQKFLLKKDAQGHSYAVTQPGLTKADLGNRILIKVNTDEAVKMAWSETYENNLGFEDFVQYLSDIVKNKTFVLPTVGAKCKDCEFVADREGFKSGFEECWKKSMKLKDNDFKKNFIFEIWDHRQKQKHIDEGLIFIEQINEDDINPVANKDSIGLSRTERQWLQIQKVQNNDNAAFINTTGLQHEFASWTYPLHFIDFETTRVAIPFNKGRRPYEQYAFQFSHHVLTESGEIFHQDEYINMEKGQFPNFAFVRALQKSLSTDQGTIFRYAAHENTVLCEIRGQLKKSNEADKDELIKFIEAITKSSKDGIDQWQGKREMVDLLELVKLYYYHPMTKGSNSIKAVLPAVLNGSVYLQKKYSKPIYGADTGIKSKNFKNKCWIEIKDGAVVNPYKLLPPLFSDLDLETMDSLIAEDSIADGGAAMTAYARMQFTEMGEAETKRVAKGLLQYCELDTLAMVMIYEYWKSEIGL